MTEPAPPYDAVALRAYERLAAAMLLAAVQDWNKFRGESIDYFEVGGYDAMTVTKTEVREFFLSDWFLVLCDGVGMDPAKMLRILKISGVPYWKMKRAERGKHPTRNKQALLC